MKEKTFSSMHTHTLFCDGKNDVETMCLAAYEKNMYALGFSAHAPISGQTGIYSNWNLKDERTNEYVVEVLAAKERWQGKLTVFLGLEADYIKGIRSPADGDIKALNLDYIIGSVHYLYPANGAEPFTVDGPAEEFERGLREGFSGNARALMHSYYDAQAEMIAVGGFDILGHADLLKKNCYGKDYWDDEEELCRQREIAAAAAEAGLIIEVNTGGINRKKTKDVYPSLPFLRFICECEIPVIITSDAHRASDIDGNYDVAVKTLVEAGFSKHVLVSSKNNGKIMLKKENLAKI